MSLSKTLLIILLIVGVFSALVVWVGKGRSDWRGYQKKFKRMELKRVAGKKERESIKSARLGAKEISVPDLNRTDRCVTCHLATDNPRYASAKQPLKYHPNINQHPIKKFGCTICHEGDGDAVAKEKAHGELKNAKNKLLPLAYIDAACAKCHSPINTPEASDLLLGHRIFEEQKCDRCHRTNTMSPRPGAKALYAGPDLVHLGKLGHSNPGRLFEYIRSMELEDSRPIKHKYSFSNTEAKALATYCLGVNYGSESNLADYYNKKTKPDIARGKVLFEQKQCLRCHAVYGRGGDIGPALTHVTRERPPEWIYNLLTAHRSSAIGWLMPRTDLTDAQAKAVSLFLASLEDEESVGYLRLPKEVEELSRGEILFMQYVCCGCHGLAGRGGVKNPNAQGGEVPALYKLADTIVLDKPAADDLVAQLMKGEPVEEKEYHKMRKLILGGKTPQKQDPSGPTPPLYMPSFKGRITDRDLDLLTAYIIELFPDDAWESWDEAEE